ncbi:MAG: lysophospholipid acyltransferase family protein [Vulcanimicrobiaceae bacterium]
MSTRLLRQAVPLYAAAHTLINLGARIWRFRVVGAEHVPLDGPLVVAANHRSYLDPMLLGAAVPRPLAYMAKEELFHIPLLGPTIRAVGAYPVDRRASPIAAIKRSVAVLRAGGAVGIFPEGTRNRDGAAAARAGVALLASMSGAAVVPAVLVGTDRALRLHRITVAFGEPIRLQGERKATRDELENFTAQVMGAIDALAGSIGGDSES